MHRSDPNLISITAPSRSDKYESKQQWGSLEPTLLAARLKELYKYLTFRKVQLCPNLSGSFVYIWRDQLCSQSQLWNPSGFKKHFQSGSFFSHCFLGARVSASLGSPGSLRLLILTANSLQRWVEIFRLWHRGYKRRGYNGPKLVFSLKQNSLSDCFTVRNVGLVIWCSFFYPLQSFFMTEACRLKKANGKGGHFFFMMIATKPGLAKKTWMYII